MKKFIFIFCFFSIIFLFSLSASAYTFTADFSDSQNLPDFSSWAFKYTDKVSIFYTSPYGGRTVLSIRGVDGQQPTVIIPLGSIFSFIDGSDLSFSLSLSGSVSNGLDYNHGSDVTICLTDSSNVSHIISDFVYEEHFAPNDNTFSTFEFSFPFHLSDFSKGDGNVYLVISYNSFIYGDIGINYLYLSSISVTDGYVGGLGDVTLQETSSFTDLQYILDLLKSFFFGGTVSDPDTGESFSFGEDGSGGVMNFVVYSSGGIDFHLWHLLVAAAIVGLGISFVVRLAGSFAPSDVIDSLDSNEQKRKSDRLSRANKSLKGK